ncbi:hypothetical protein K439DRAFT_1642869 [Ramaria rubella]|nr:hypothetical protein K439DRAFT_1642869 [Ramaria rubella]
MEGRSGELSLVELSSARILRDMKLYFFGLLRVSELRRLALVNISKRVNVILLTLEAVGVFFVFWGEQR